MIKKIIFKNSFICLILIILLFTTVLIMDSQAQRSLLYWGTRNEDVRVLQRRLSQWGYYNGPISGVFGQQTYNAVRSFQSRNGLRVDGIVGPETWGALGYTFRREPATQQTAATGNTYVNRRDDLQLLARIIYAEARGEPYEGQVAVGAVLLNRVRDGAFPNSVSAVIYQPLAFESVADGQFYLAPDDQSIRAAQAALNGYDPTYGSLFFWNPGKPVNPWIWSRNIVRTIGSHVFAH